MKRKWKHDETKMERREWKQERNGNENGTVTVR